MIFLVWSIFDIIIPYVLGFCSTCVDYCLVVLDRQKINLYLTILNLVLSISPIYIGFLLTNDFIGGIMGYAISQIIYHYVNLNTIFYYLKLSLLKINILLLSYIGGAALLYFFKSLLF